MSTKTTLTFFRITGAVVPLLFLFSRPRGAGEPSGILIFSAVVMALLGLGLLLYALYREKAFGDKSETLSCGKVMALIGVVCAWATFCIYRGIHH
jgi:hypothetical protein